MQIFSSKKGSDAGLDLGQHWAKLVQLQPKRKQTVLSRIGRLVWDKEEKEDDAKMAAKLSQMWDSLAIKEKRVISALAGHGVIIKYIDLPGQTQDTEGYVRQQAQEYIPFDLSEVYLDHQFLDTDTSGQSMKTVLVASKKTMIDELRNLFRSASLSLGIVDVEGFALSNCFEFNYPEQVSELSYILDIGSTSSIFCVYSRGYPLFIRDLSIGGDQITEKIRRHFNVQHSEAEQIKLQGLDQTDRSGKERVEKDIKNTLVSWTQDIQRLITLHKNSEQGQEQGAGKLYLAGGGSLYPGLKETVAEELNMTVQHLNPLRNITYDERTFDAAYIRSCAPQYAVATGLAIRGLT
ncbi:MAG: type IV pilus assembly protein PilM [Desulfohalobiaceae bacterium]|nr:type IV pilus assembly protein PilM [Desulfohalobiaceae bacterium]